MKRAVLDERERGAWRGVLIGQWIMFISPRLGVTVYYCIESRSGSDVSGKLNFFS